MSEPRDPAENPPVATRVFDEKASELARTYAEALIGAAAKEGSVDEVLEELAAIRTFVIEQYPAFALMMTSPVRNTADKDRILVKAFEGHTLPISLRFHRVLNRHGRLDLIGRVLIEAKAVWDRRQNRQPVSVRSAVPLSDAQLEAVRARLQTQLGATPVLHSEVDPNLIGGLVVQIGDHVYDGSVRNRLEQLRTRLIEGKSHEIQSRRDHFSHPE
jgi:F-type H+-transporting ATPase subunit delta